MAYSAMIIGGSGAIATALRQNLAHDADCQQIYVFSRQQPSEDLPDKVI